MNQSSLLLAPLFLAIFIINCGGGSNATDAKTTLLTLTDSQLEKIIYNPKANTILVYDAAKNSVIALNADTNEQTEPYALAGQTLVTWDFNTDYTQLYVLVVDDNSTKQIYPLDINSNGQLKAKTGTTPEAIELSLRPISLLGGADNRLFYTGQNAQNQYIFAFYDLETSTPQLLSSPSSFPLTLVGRNSAASLLYVAKNNPDEPTVQQWQISAKTQDQEMIQEANLIDSPDNISPRTSLILTTPEADNKILIFTTTDSNTDDGEIPIYSTDTLQYQETLDVDWQPTAIALTPDSKRVIIVHDNTVSNSQKKDAHYPDHLGLHVFGIDTTPPTDLRIIEVPEPIHPNGLVITQGNKIFAILGKENASKLAIIELPN